MEGGQKPIRKTEKEVMMLNTNTRTTSEINSCGPPAAQAASPTSTASNDNHTTSSFSSPPSPHTLIMLAFGNKSQHWNFPPGWDAATIANKRVKRQPPANCISGKEQLKFWGIVKNEVTKPLFVYAQRQAPVPGLSMHMVAMKFISKLSMYMWQERCTLIDDMTVDRNEIVIGRDGSQIASGAGVGATIHLLPGFGDGEDEQNAIADAIAAVLGEVPADHVRFYHGTSASSAASMLTDGILPDIFDPRGDFGPGLYCSQDVNISVDYADSSKYNDETRGVVLAFDIPVAKFNDLCTVHLQGSQWANLVCLCKKLKHKTAFGNNTEYSDAQVVIGGISDPTTSDPLMPIQESAQQVFRLQSWNLLFEELTKVKGVAFDLALESDTEEHYD